MSIIDKYQKLPDINNMYDLCIIGSGPAGGTIANILAHTGSRICVLESGNIKPDQFTDALRDLDSEGIFIKTYSRERVVGGTSTSWSGLSSTLDTIDFKKRYWVRYSGWPISREELIPYYTEASKAFRFPSIEKFNDLSWMDINNVTNKTPDWRKLQGKIFIAPETPQNYCKEFQDIYKNENVDLYTGVTITHFMGDNTSGIVKKAVAHTMDGKQYEFQARYFVLAAGGIENSRLLLNSTFACPNGLGNDRDQVGRYFMNHPKNNYGIVRLKNPVNELPGYFGFMSYKKGYSGYIGLRIREEYQQREEILNSYIRFEPIYDWSNRDSIQCLNYFTKRSRLIMSTFKNIKRGKTISLRDYSETGDDSDIMNERKNIKDMSLMTGKIVADLPAVSKYLYYRFFDNKKVWITALNVRNFMEMEPLPDNLVKLSRRRDVFNMPVAYVCHKPSELDKKSMYIIHKYLANELSTSGWGKLFNQLYLDIDPWPIDNDSSHHLGGTRMGDDILTSVTNKDCRLHFSPNVYVAGASLFPTSGNANPTYTIVALSIRLAEHLRTKILTNRIYSHVEDL
jgi:choline dehydrogenase-like flavoprotein